MTSTASVSSMACLFCGEPELVEIHEIWDHEFMFETCCEGLHEQIVIDMGADPSWAKELLRRLDIEPLTGRRLRRVAEDGCTGMVLDWQLQLGPGAGFHKQTSRPLRHPHGLAIS
jgi:hypothetical protein